MGNELPQEDKELIAKIDERLKHYKLITDNKQPICSRKMRPQKELYYITIVGNSIHITTRFGLDLERAAQEIRKTLENL